MPENHSSLCLDFSRLVKHNNTFCYIICPRCRASCRARNEIRYYHPEDRELARHVAQKVKDALGVELPAVTDGNDDRPVLGYFEIWIAQIPDSDVLRNYWQPNGVVNAEHATALRAWLDSNEKGVDIATFIDGSEYATDRSKAIAALIR